MESYLSKSGECLVVTKICCLNQKTKQKQKKNMGNHVKMGCFLIVHLLETHKFNSVYFWSYDFTFLLFLFSTNTLRLGLSPLHIMTHDQGFQNLTWTSLSYDLWTTILHKTFLSQSLPTCVKWPLGVSTRFPCKGSMFHVMDWCQCIMQWGGPVLMEHDVNRVSKFGTCLWILIRYTYDYIWLCPLLVMYKMPCIVRW